MGSVSRLFHGLPASRSRAYSSFFSSKPGGGRYFNPAKPPKVVPSASKKNNKQVVDAASTSPETVDSTTTTNSSSSASETTNTHQDDPSSTSTSFAGASRLSHFSTRSNGQIHSHPVIADKDIKMHQFFSLHRPLLLIQNPSSIFTSPPEGTSLFSQAPPPRQSNPNPHEMPQEISYEADAETARNLTRAITMSRLGSAAAWEATLQRLGLEPEHSFTTDVVMDSVKRKRRKKMKKHKLKKRRRLTRYERLKK